MAIGRLAERHPEQEVGERHVGEQLPLGDDPLQVLDGVAAAPGVLGEQLAQRGHAVPSLPLPISITPRAKLGASQSDTREEETMSRRARKRRDRKKGGANHGKRPNT